ncbi:hypothetical protein LOD99_6999 [Oopsacas minuta]|uniref:Mitochondria-eating protein n=1 Tax=Oopsacas minuta TaxID=111878 RepID=A0AAV7JKE6_9METZ|nr:hypothetical protein LOD99_6999 [Oopsacas minuta]
MEWDELRQLEPALTHWLEKYSSITLVSDSKRMVEEVKEIFKDKNLNTSALVLKYHRIEELVMRCIHHLTREGRLDQLDDSLTQLPDQVFASCIPNLSYVELTYHFPQTLSLCARLIHRFYRIKQRRKLPIPVIDTLLYQLCLWLFKSTLQEQDFSHYMTEIKECLSAIQQLEPNLVDRVYRNRDEINSILDSLASHPYRSTLIEDSIKSKVEGKLKALRMVSNKLESLSQREMISISQMLHEGQRHSVIGNETFDSFSDPLFTYTQLEERISLSIELVKAVGPIQRQDNLAGLTDSLEKRIMSDQATVALIDKLSTHSFDTLIQDEPVDAMLMRYLQGIEILLSITKDGEIDKANTNGIDGGDNFVSEACLIFPEYHSYAEAFYPLSNNKDNTPNTNPITSSTPLRTNSQSLPSIDEIKVVQTPELQTVTILHSLPTSPSQLSQLEDSQSIIASSPSNLDSERVLQAEAEIAMLKSRISDLEGKYKRSRGSLVELHKREKGLQEKVTIMTKKHIQQDRYIEEIYLPQYRRSEVVKRFTNMYMQERLDCLEAFRSKGFSSDKTNRIIFSILKTAYEYTCREDRRITQQLQILLEIPNNPVSSLAIQDSVYTYLRKENVILPSLLPVLTDRVISSVLAGNGELLDLINTRLVRVYAKSCVELSWGILIQSPRLYLGFKEKRFNPDIHRRFFSSDQDSEIIQFFVWPSLLESGTLRTLCQGIVVT